MHLPNGTLLRGGTYKIVRFIANGGFGCTYEAIHPLLGKRVAIKEFFPETLCNRDPETSYVTVGTLKQKPLADKLKKKFINEAGAIAQLSHPGIVKVNDVFEENGTAYYVMDYIDGQSLNKIIAERGPLSEKEALHYIRQVCDALAFVHSKNRLHLDIKPGNIMIDTEGHAILIDFGASKQYDEEKGENTSTIIGKTPGYAPIEQMGNDVSGFKQATDIYALGATLYKCLTGKTPLESTQLANGEELDPLPSNVSEFTKKAISAAMQVASKKRPQSIKEFLTILDPSNNNIEIDEKTIYDTPQKKSSSPSNKIVEDKSAYELPLKVSEPVKQNPSNPVTSSVSSKNQDAKHYTNKNDENFTDSKSSKTKVYLGIVATFIIAFLCWMAFGGNDTTTSNKSGEEIALLADSLNNSDEQLAEQNNQGLNEEESLPVSKDSSPEDIKNPPLQIIPAPNVSEQNDQTQFVKEELITQPNKVDQPLSISGQIDGHDYVDLGLPSGLKWATCNVGASRPEDYGSHFAWGETRTKSTYDKSNSETYEKDFQWLRDNGYIGENGNLTLIHDAAHQKWGGSWRMPSSDEIDELRNNTKTEWTTRNGVNGRLFISKKNGNSIFLPAAGCRFGSSLNNTGELGYYWSLKPLDISSVSSGFFWFTSDNLQSGWGTRLTGFSVRPVSK